MSVDISHPTAPPITGAPSETETWTLDAPGNQLAVTVNGTTTENTYNAENELTSTTVSYGGSITSSETLSYDANGNLLTNSSDWNNYLYDAWNRNVGDAYGGGASPIYASGQSEPEQYIYDALGRRIYNAATGQDIYYDGWQRIEDAISSAEPGETSDGPADVNEYVWSPAYQNALIERDAMKIMSYGGGLYTANLGSQRLYATQDADWNTTALIDTSGAAVERYQYDPYGQVTYLDSGFTPLETQASNFNWVYLFQGGVLDNNNLYWFEHRDENPTTGNWDEQDPAGYINGAGTYQFAGSSPIGVVDPLGLDSEGAVAGPNQAAANAANVASQMAQQAATSEANLAAEYAAWEQTPTGQAALRKELSGPVLNGATTQPTTQPVGGGKTGGGGGDITIHINPNTGAVIGDNPLGFTPLPSCNNPVAPAGPDWQDPVGIGMIVIGTGGLLLPALPAMGGGGAAVATGAAATSAEIQAMNDDLGSLDSQIQSLLRQAAQFQDECMKNQYWDEANKLVNEADALEKKIIDAGGSPR